MAYQVKYDCGVRGGCGATETASRPAPLVCAHGGIKRDAPEVDARLDGAGTIPQRTGPDWLGSSITDQGLEP